MKTAAYGLLRFALPLFPNASAEFAPIAMWLGVIGIFYGAWMAFSQYDIKRLIAYTSVSHMGFVLIAIYTGSQPCSGTTGIFTAKAIKKPSISRYSTPWDIGVFSSSS